MGKKTIGIPFTSNQAEKASNEVKKALNLPDDMQIGMFLTKKNHNLPDFTMVFQAVNAFMLKDMKPSTLKVMFLLICRAQYGNQIGIHQLTIAEETKQSIRTVNQAIKELKAQNIVIQFKDITDHRQQCYAINPTVAWRGKAGNRVKAIFDADPNQLRLFGVPNDLQAQLKPKIKK